MLFERDPQRLKGRSLHYEVLVRGKVVVPAIELRTEDGEPGELLGARWVLQAGDDVEGRLDEVGRPGRADGALAEQEPQQCAVDVGPLRRAEHPYHPRAQMARVAESDLVERSDVADDRDG